MTKAELVARIASEDGITKSQADKALDGFLRLFPLRCQEVTRLPL
jgi:nucleoid DNA-binding protein